MDAQETVLYVLNPDAYIDAATESWRDELAKLRVGQSPAIKTGMPSFAEHLATFALLGRLKGCELPIKLQRAMVDSGLDARLPQSTAELTQALEKIASDASAYVDLRARQRPELAAYVPEAKRLIADVTKAIYAAVIGEAERSTASIKTRQQAPVTGLNNAG